MKNILLLACSITLACSWTSCKDQESYADLVAKEKESISTWISVDPKEANFGSISTKDEEWVNNITEYVLTDSLHPEQCGLELNKWYGITEGDFKRLYFCIRSWGKDGLDTLRAKGITPTDEQYMEAMRNKKKFYTGKDVLVRYDDLYVLNEYDYDDEEKNTKLDNQDPNSYLICYKWNSYYYANSSYAYYYGWNNNYECTSGGVAFPIRFLWEGATASIICPFSLVESTFSNGYYTMYYGSIEYKKPNYLPQ